MADERGSIELGTLHLRAAFNWLESTLGPYRFGNQAGPVSVRWGEAGGGAAGIEHHPRWHISATALASPEIQTHEAIHGWFGNGVRLACREDFVLSEGTTTYLTGRVLDVVAPDVGARVWAVYATQLRSVVGDQPVWPTASGKCNQIDVVSSGLYSRAPYLRGAFFYRALALTLGASTRDHALARSTVNTQAARPACKTCWM